MSNTVLQKTVIRVEVLSDTHYDPQTLADVHMDITEGDCSGKWNIIEQVELSKKDMSDALIAQGSDPQFLLGENDNETDELAD